MACNCLQLAESTRRSRPRKRLLSGRSGVGGNRQQCAALQSFDDQIPSQLGQFEGGKMEVEESKIRGSCLCGSVKFEIEPKLGIYRYCFCTLCRKNRGTRLAANILVGPEAFHWTSGESLVGRFYLPDSRFGNCFCSHCGTPMPRHTLSGNSVVIPVGVLDDDPGVQPNHVVFWDSRVSWLPDEAALGKHSTFASS